MVVYNAKAKRLLVFNRPPCANGFLGRSVERDGETWTARASSERVSGLATTWVRPLMVVTTEGRDVDLCWYAWLMLRATRTTANVGTEG